MYCPVVYIVFGSLIANKINCNAKNTKRAVINPIFAFEKNELTNKESDIKLKQNSKYQSHSKPKLENKKTDDFNMPININEITKYIMVYVSIHET